MNRQNIFIDADDTLWDNNIYYEQSILDFSRIVSGLGFEYENVEQKLRITEMDNVKHYGYGSYSFGKSLLQVYTELCEEKCIEKDRKLVGTIESLSVRVREYPIKLLKGVEDTLKPLSEAHRLILFTKGANDEQLKKVERSNVDHYFEDVVVAPEKDKEVYKGLLERFDLNVERTWMIGNSPRSDINPAKSIGMKTVLIPYHSTWEHEVEKINDDGPETIVVEDFSKLKDIFLV